MKLTNLKELNSVKSAVLQEIDDSKCRILICQDLI